MVSEVLKVRPGAVAWQQIDGETVLLDLTTSEYLGVNEAGTLLWKNLTDGTTRVALVAALQERFGLDDDQAATDVEAFLADLMGRDLIDIS